jgi:hypothetical protein
MTCFVGGITCGIAGSELPQSPSNSPWFAPSSSTSKLEESFLSILPLQNRQGWKKFVMMAGRDGDALAGSMEEALERQQEAAEARRARKDTSSQQERERKAKDESLRLSRARIEEQ